MKRPEGFDPAPPQQAAREKTARERVVRAKPAREKVVREKPAREKSVRERAPRDTGARPAASHPQPGRRGAARAPRTPAREAMAQSETPRAAARRLRAAERARRRVEKQELRRFTRRIRTRRIAWATGLGLIVALVGISLTAVYSPLLALREIRIDGTERLDPDQLRDAIDGQLGRPLALLDEDRIRAELGEFSLIRAYTTELLPPGTLIVHIDERTPVGALVRGDGFDVVDAAGVVITHSPERPEGMPVIQVEGDDVESAAFRSIAEVLLALPPKIAEKVDRVSASTRDDVTLSLSGSKQRVEWGSAERSDHKARVLEALLDIHRKSGPGLYDVSAPGTAVFRRD